MQQQNVMLNMFGAVGSSAKVKASPYQLSRNHAIPSKEEAGQVLSSLEDTSEEMPLFTSYLEEIRQILRDLTEGDTNSFLEMDDEKFELYNRYIADRLTQQQIDKIEQQAREESTEYVTNNALFFDLLRDEGLNYDHLTDEQIQVLKLRQRQRTVTERMEGNAGAIGSTVSYQTTVGPDGKEYIQGGIVHVDREQADQVEGRVSDLKQSREETELSGQFADFDELTRISQRRSRTVS